MAKTENVELIRKKMRIVTEKCAIRIDNQKNDN